MAKGMPAVDEAEVAQRAAVALPRSLPQTHKYIERDTITGHDGAKTVRGSGWVGRKVPTSDV